MTVVLAWLDRAIAAAHEIMVQHFVKVQDNPATGMRECTNAIRAAAQLSAFKKARVCAERGGMPDMIGLATEEVIALAATPTWATVPTEDLYERYYLSAWACLLHAQRSGEI